MREKYVDGLEQMEESRRLIRQSRALIDLTATDIVRSKEIIAEARRLLASLQASQ
jgi:hypothetical protein